MNEKEFNLLDEPWLRVIDDTCHTKEVSLIELFRDAHLYKDLCGELPTQDFAVMRLLLAVLHTVFSRYDPDGKESPPSDPDDALDRWKAIWENEKFPSKVIADYLESQRESFYLFHPERPFFQVAEISRFNKIQNGKYDAKKLNGILSKSGNRERLFAMIGGVEAEYLTNDQAARWLINLIGYDDNAIKAGTGIGWLGNLGLIAAAGNNLFETLMLNFMIYNINNDKIWGHETPIWEQPIWKPKDEIPLEKKQEKNQIVFPDNLSQLYTLPSRRVLLTRSEDSKDECKVNGYKILGGDYFDSETAFYEPMTTWSAVNQNNAYTPKRHDPAIQFWRNFSAIFTDQGERKRPGIISWLIELSDLEIISKNPFICFKIASIKYDSKHFKVENIFSDSLQMHASLLSEMNGEWQEAVKNSIEFCHKIAKEVKSLAQRINLATGGNDKQKDNNGSAAVFADRAKAEFYDRLDLPFREWLCALDPETDDAEERETEWQEQCLRIARELGSELIGTVRTEAIFGRRIKKEGEKSKIYSAAEAENQFFYELKRIQNK